MDDTEQYKDCEYTRANAKNEFEKGNYPLAKTILETLWQKSNKNDPYLLYDYGNVLRKINESIKFVEICRELNNNKLMMTNKYIISLLCWCIYDSCIKNYSVEDKDNFDAFIKRALYIKDNCQQLKENEYFKNPYVMTIKKVVKSYNERASKNYKEIIKWLSYLDPDILSESVFNFKDETGKDRELASLKEFYYQHKAKALEKLEKYEDCITICEAAFQNIKKFHYRNDKWIKARLYFSKCMVHEDIESALDDYKNLAYKENYWYMYHKLSQICFRYNKMPDSLLYASKAYGCRFEYEKMVNLLLDTALLWEAIGNSKNAKIFFQASAYYRKRQGWSIPEELQYSIKILEIDVEKKPNIKLLQDISKNYVFTFEGNSARFEGKVHKIFPHGGSGFIKPNDGSSNIYFNMLDVNGKKILNENDHVEYEIIKGKDERIRAIKITMRG